MGHYFGWVDVGGALFWVSGVDGALFWVGGGGWSIILGGWGWLGMSWGRWGWVGVRALFDNAHIIHKFLKLSKIGFPFKFLKADFQNCQSFKEFQGPLWKLLISLTSSGSRLQFPSISITKSFGNLLGNTYVQSLMIII